MAFFARSGKARPAVFDMRARARGELPARRFAAAERARHFGKIEPEHVVQQEARALERRQALEHEHQRHRNIVRQIAGGVVVESLVDHRLRQPLPDIELAPRPRRFHAVEAEPRHDRAEIMPRLLDRRAIGRVPAQIGVLHHILGLGARAEHAIGKPGQRAPMRLEILHAERSCVVTVMRQPSRSSASALPILGQFAQHRLGFAADLEPRASVAVAERIFQASDTCAPPGSGSASEIRPRRPQCRTTSSRRSSASGAWRSVASVKRTASATSNGMA